MRPPTGQRRAILCADDYGYSESVSEAIVELTRLGRLGAVGVMTAGPQWAGAARRLEEVPTTVRIGLHVNLTEGPSLTGRFVPRPPGRLALDTLAGRLDVRSVYEEIAAQWRAFEEGLGRTPDFVDTHQHVHLLAAVREPLLCLLDEKASLAPVRNLWPAVGPRNALMKRAVFLALGAPFMSSQLRTRGRCANTAFGGLQAFDESVHVERDWRTLFESLPDGALVACHPACAADPVDPIGSFRVAEYAWLRSPSFAQASEAANIRWQSEFFQADVCSRHIASRS